MSGLVKPVKPPTALLVDTPNLSVMLPGACNAKCEFCFWNRDQQANKFPMMDFADRLAKVLDSLPSQFSQVSVTGGEPTISPVLDEVMDVAPVYTGMNPETPPVLVTPVPVVPQPPE